jgi:hypothetical protein
VILAPAIDARRAESLYQELRRYAPQYTAELDLSDEQSAAVALMRICAFLAESITSRLDQVPDKNFVAFLDQLGIGLLPARPSGAVIAFRVASGVQEAIRVPAGARVTAAAEGGEIPFETSGDLIALPDSFRAAYGVDPSHDFIFRPPPEFLSQQPRTPTELKYVTLSFMAAGSNRLQLNHTTELKPGSFVRIGESTEKIVQKVDESNIVTLDNPVDQDFAQGTSVTPIRDFEVFNGINVQEHVLYLGHAGLLTVKEEAEITLKVSLAEVPGEGLLPLNLVWQFWTEDDTQGQHWQDLTVKNDATNGLAASGDIILAKPDKLEIKERDVNGTKSRWIRAQLQDRLPAGSRALPQIDAIKIGVKSPPAAKPGEGFPADQGFTDATPLDMSADTGFLPFGTEPRQFDQFYIASKEAFSKRDATVHLNFELDLQTLAAPSVVPAGQLRAYSIGLRRRLYELNTENGQWAILGSPFDTGISERPQGSRYFPVEDSVPSAVAGAANNCIFVKTEDSLDQDANKANKLWVCRNSDPPFWQDLDAPPSSSGKKSLAFGPAATLVPGGPAFARVFVISGDGKLCSRDITNVPAPSGIWQQYLPPTNYSAVHPWKSAPFVTVTNGDIVVFITGSDGNVHRITFPPAAAPDWTPLVPDNPSFEAVSRPFAQPFVQGADTHAKVVVFARETGGARSWKLFECDTRSKNASGKFQWHDLGTPGTSQDFGSNPDDYAPSGFLEEPSETVDVEGKHIFLRGADSRLYERLDDTSGGDPKWEKRPLPGDPALRGSPAVRVDPAPAPPPAQDTVRVLAATDKNSLVTWTFEATRDAIAAVANGLAALLNKDLASGVNGRYEGETLDITAGTGSGQSRSITAYDGELKLARLHSQLIAPPDHTSECQIDGEDLGAARDKADHVLAFHDAITDSPATNLIAIRVDGDYKDSDFYSRITGLLSLKPADAAGLSFALYAQLATTLVEFCPLEDTNTVPDLSWEYWNGRGWLSLPLRDDETHNFLSSGEVTFSLPLDSPIESTEVAGQENFWIRVRLVGGDYGRETFRMLPDTGEVVSEKSSLRPPKITELRIHYEANPALPEACLTFNNLDYLDQTAACQTADAHFPPFETLENTSFALFFGFDHTFKTGPVRLLLDAAERDFDETRPPEFQWTFRKDRQWKELDTDDASVALTRPGILTLSASEELTLESRFGQALFWIRGALRLREGFSQTDYAPPLLRGVFLNTVPAVQGETITEVIVASSDGEPKQKHALQRPNVLDGEDIRVREVLTEEERERIERDLGEDSVLDREDLGGTWVRWQQVPALFDCRPDDRCYTIDRATGTLQFGDGVHGSIPPAGVDNIRAFRYRTGGGVAGNVGAGKIVALGTAVAGIESVLNPTPAGGGSDKADNAAMLTIGPRRLSHRDRAVSAEDFEELAFEASRQVAKVRCLVTANLKPASDPGPDPCDSRRRHQALDAPGWVSLIVVPDSNEPRPCPSLELRRAVKNYLRARAPSVVAAGERIVVRPPDYIIVAIVADIFVSSLEKASIAETAAKNRLEEFLHPLHGGPTRNGWEFGRPVLKSDIFAVLERIAEIDHVENLVFRFDGRTSADAVEIAPNELIASGEHELKVKEL